MLKMTSRSWVWGGVFGACLILAASRLTGSAVPTAPTARTAAPAPNAAPPQVDVAPARLPAAPRQHAGANLYTVELAVQQARARGAGENEAYRLRAAVLSAQTIALLTEREQAEMAWNQRVEAWHAERAILNLTETAALRQRRFSPAEQTQLDAAAQSDAPKLILEAP